MGDLANIGTAALNKRKSEGLGTIHSIAKELRISPNDISEIERGIFHGSILNVVKYLQYLGLSLTVVEPVRPTLDNIECMFEDED